MRSVDFTVWWYAGLVAAMVVLRLAELRISKRNTTCLLAAGGRESGAGHYPAMVVMHTLWLASCLAEVVILRRPFLPALGFTMTAVLAGTVALRHWVIRTLGTRWTTRVITVPGAPRITTGPFRWLRHPNYAAVAVEVVALPLIHTAWISAVLFGAANLIVLRYRIRVEEDALEEAR